MLTYNSKNFSRKTYIDRSLNATIAKHLKDSFERRNLSPKTAII